MSRLDNRRIPYPCPLPDSNTPPPKWEYGNCLVRTRWGASRQLLTAVLRLGKRNIVLWQVMFKED